ERDEFTYKRVYEVKEHYRAYKEVLNLVFSFACLLIADIWLVGSDNNLSITQKLNEVLLKNHFGWGLVAYYVYWSVVIIIILFSDINLAQGSPKNRGFVRLPRNCLPSPPVFDELRTGSL